MAECSKFLRNSKGAWFAVLVIGLVYFCSLFLCDFQIQVMILLFYFCQICWWQCDLNFEEYWGWFILVSSSVLLLSLLIRMIHYFIFQILVLQFQRNFPEVLTNFGSMLLRGCQLSFSVPSQLLVALCFLFSVLKLQTIILSSTSANLFCRRTFVCFEE